MQNYLNVWLSILIGIAISLPLYSQVQETSGAEQVFSRVKNNVVLLGDGENQAWGLYLAGRRDKKFIFMLSVSNLNVGLERQMHFELSGGKKSVHDAEQVQVNSDLRVAIYQVDRSPKDDDLEPITKYPANKKPDVDSLWIFGSRPDLHKLRRVNVEGYSHETAYFTVRGQFGDEVAGMPIFSTSGEILGILDVRNSDGSFQALSLQALSIEKLIQFAVTALVGEDLFPTWKELYPSKYAIEKVLASSAILLTEKPGTGFFIGRDKDDVGYLLTANHVVAKSAEEGGGAVDSFNVYFFQDQVNPVWGSVIPESQDTVLDMAVVRVRNCPAVPPMTILRTGDLEKIEKGVAVPTVANVGLALESNKEYGFFEFETGKIEKAAGDRTIQTNLPVISGHSGGPVFNGNGEIMGITLKTELSETGDTLSVANHNRTILQYFDTSLKGVDFKEKWQFLQRPSFWRRNQLWLLSGGAAVVAGASAILLRKSEEPAEFPSASSLGTPGGGQ